VTGSSDVVRTYFASFATGDIDEVARFHHPDVEWRAVEGAADDAGTLRGDAAVRRYCQDWLDTLEDLRAEVVEVLYEDGGRVAVTVRNAGRGRASGAEAHGRYHVACLVSDGLIRSGREFASAEEAVAAARWLG
jgi:ketosteroid isomerase-like protein